MKNLTVLASTLALVGVALIGCDAKNLAGTNTTTTKTDAEYVARGKYIAATSECITCHTPLGATGPDVQRLGEGGNAWLTPTLGIGVSVNITPYEGSTIKELTVDELADQWLKTKDGDFLPPMPGLGKYDREDLKALAHYFKTLPAKENKAPASFRFAGKTGDAAKKWPYPALPGGTDSQGEAVLGAFEMVVSPLTNGPLNQAMIDANIAAAGAPQ